MNITEEFIHSEGTVIGSMHRNNFKNNQDAYWFISNEDCIVALVGDGCGSGDHSEVGSKLILPIIAADIAQHVGLGESIENSIDSSLKAAKDFIRSIAIKIPIPAGTSIEKYFLFTIVGTVVTRDETVVFSIGDGVYSVNGSVHIIDQNNAPNYLSYTTLNDKEPEFVINVKMPTETVDSIIIATDGAIDIINNEDQNFKFGLVNKQVGNITQFVEGNMKGSSIRLIKHLNVLSKQNIVSDDTTIITITRTPKGE